MPSAIHRSLTLFGSLAASSSKWMIFSMNRGSSSPARAWSREILNWQLSEISCANLLEFSLTFEHGEHR
ncbi:hypothetical protein MLD38_027607 [Melastoma candidum]|uniref:Uncharacterized protein n=1 Tax=Melastoma candidum TaxID=119954 RepID=A0ACB9P412_9MYRT|nr:hypothetical protein MLD38_027607 [Melastoma candidum]